MHVRAQGGGETHECDRCGETFPTEQELEQHVAEEHSDAGVLAPDVVLT
jgi:uncharacterized C2H2 Zn-finger protein